MAHRPRRSRTRGPAASRRQESRAVSASRLAPSPATAVVAIPAPPERRAPALEPEPRSAPRSAEVCVPVPLAVERPGPRADAGRAVDGTRTERARPGAVVRLAAALWASVGRLAARSARAPSSARQGPTRAAHAGASARSSSELRAGEAVYARVVASIERHATALAGQRRRGIARDAFGKVVDTQGWLDSRAAYVDRCLALPDADYRALGAYFRAVERAAVPERSHVRARLTGLVLERELERCLANRVTATHEITGVRMPGDAAVADTAAD